MVREHTSVLAEAEKRLLVRMAGAAAGLGQFGPPDARWARWRWSASGSPSGPAARRSLLVDPAARAQLVRRQPRRHAGARPQPAAPALRLLRGSRPGRRGLRLSLRRPDARRPHEPDARPRVPGRLLPAGGRDRAGHARARDLPARRSGKIGPTELRILLAIGTLQLMRSDMVTHPRAPLAAVRRRRRGGDRGVPSGVRRRGHQDGVALYREERLPEPTANHEDH